MTWSLQIQNGDLTVSNAHLGMATGTQKLEQDLGNWILTKMGTDIMNPTYGSLLDGGIMANGVIAETLIGQVMDPLAVDSELRRIVSEYQIHQATRAQSDRTTYNKTTLTADEIVVSLDDIQYEQVGDQLTATISITTAAKNQTSVNVTLPGL